MDAAKSTFVLYPGDTSTRDRKGIFLVQTALCTEASRDVALIGEAQKTKYF